MKILWILMIISSSFFGSEFEHLMKEESADWIYLSKEEDVAALERFDALFEKNKHLKKDFGEQVKIPLIIHFICLGSLPPSKEKISTWIEHHPNWIFKLWSDRNMDLSEYPIQQKDAQTFPFLYSRKAFEAAKSLEEKANILGLEILYQEGGLLVDVKSRCLKSFEKLHRGYDFYCALNAPHPPVAGRNISLMHEIIGAIPFHPIIGQMIRSKPTSYINVILHSLEEDGNADIVFPAAYFSSEDGYATFEEIMTPTNYVARTLNKKEEIPNWMRTGAISLNFAALIGILWFYLVRRNKRREG